MDPAGRVVNVFEKSIEFVIGLGSHARTFLHRTPHGTPLELPLGWYVGKGSYLAMNPVYDPSGHEVFRLKKGDKCIYCHCGYPRISSGHERPFA